MKGSVHGCRRPHAAGFSVIELMLVLLLSSIVVVGFTAMIQVPGEMAADQNRDNPSVSSSDTTLAALDRDIRYATVVRVPTALRIEADQSDGSTVVWEHAGMTGRPLTRTAGGQTIAVLKDVSNVAFGLIQQNVVKRTDEQRIVTNTPVTTAQFDTFSLKSSFTFSVIRGLVTVLLNTADCAIASHDRVGIYLTPASLGTDLGIPSSVRVRLKRSGGNDVLVNIYEATSQKKPDRTKLVATGKVNNRSIPLSYGDVTIPLAMAQKIDPTKGYFIELSSSGGSAATVEGLYLSIAGAAAAAATGLYSDNADGTNYNPLASLLDASQTKFALDVVRVTVDTSPLASDGLPPGYQSVAVPVAVAVRVALNTPLGVESIRGSIPIANSVATITK